MIFILIILIFANEEIKPEMTRIVYEFKNEKGNKRIAFGQNQDEEPKFQQNPHHDPEFEKNFRRNDRDLPDFHHHHLRDHDISSPSINCTYPNTKASFDNKCICMEGYFGDNPVTERGCWNCSEKCHSEASCNYPGNCTCLYNYIGDGISICEPPIPIINSIETSFENFIQNIKINYFTNNSYFPFIAYCRFSNKIVISSIVSPTLLNCLVPNISTTTSIIEISFNLKNWSNSKNFNIEKKEIQKIKIQKTIIKPKIILIKKDYYKRSIISIIIGLLFIIYYHITKKKKNNKSEKSDQIHNIINNENILPETKKRKLDL